MRTTLTLDPDVSMRIDKLVKERRMTMKQIVNQALRSGGLGEIETPRKTKPFKVRPFPGKLMPGLDPYKLGRLADQLEDEYIIGKMMRDTSGR